MCCRVPHRVPLLAVLIGGGSPTRVMVSVPEAVDRGRGHVGVGAHVCKAGCDAGRAGEQ